MKVNTIGVGATPPFVDLLDNIATATGGLSKLTTAPDEELRRFYVEELVDTLRQFSASHCAELGAIISASSKRQLERPAGK